MARNTFDFLILVFDLFAMKSLLFFVILLCPSILLGGLGIQAMKGEPPRAEAIGQILCDVRDAGWKGFENHVLTKPELSRFLSSGRFATALNERQTERAKREEKNSKGGPVYCSGVFATKDGRVFKFRRPNKEVLEIEGVDGVGWFIVDGDKPPN
jgi:hypothetical protein